MGACLTLGGIAFIGGASTGSVFFFGCGMVTAGGFVLLAMVFDDIYGG